MRARREVCIKILLVATGLLLIPLSLAGCATAEKQPIVFGDCSWDSVQVHDRIAGFIVEHGYGYEVEIIPAETAALWTGMRQGDVDVNMESWTENILDIYTAAIESGDCVDLGPNYPDSGQGWLVPTYIIEGDAERGIEAVAPDLKTIDDMPEYWELFKDPEQPDKGRFHNSIPGWKCTELNSLKLQAYGLDEYYNDFICGSDAALSGSMFAAYEKGEPWFGYYWEPTWVLGLMDMTYVEEPPFDQAEWDNETYGCAFPPTQVNIIVNSGLLERAPDVVEFLESYETTAALNNKILAYMQETEADTMAAALYFLEEFESVWTKWVSADVANKVKAALP
ncbi:MAG: ABC transporter substrate-binding protein [Chloroflexi bacterium]|nr:ABC transporter substrate-binding protein [Chloroflexota bacterium]